MERDTDCTAQYFEGDPGPPVQVYADNMNSFGRGVVTELRRESTASLIAIGAFAGGSSLAYIPIGGTTLMISSTPEFLTITPLVASEQGAIIGWGTSNAAVAVAKTQQVIASLTRTKVAQMVARGLSKEWVKQQLARYLKDIAEGGKKLDNTQLLPRKELMEKILELWPK